jgi:hypothetical protein
MAEDTSATTGAARQDGEAVHTDTGTAADALSMAVRALTQATQAMAATTTHMLQTPRGVAGGTNVESLGQATVGGAVPAAAPAQVNALEDDLYSEAFLPTAKPANATPIAASVPVINAPLLRVTILGPQPLPVQHAPGTAGFRYWTAAEALARGVGFWAPLLPAGTSWSTLNPVLQATLVAGEALNAFYSRPVGLNFFQRTVRGVTVFSGESPDVVCHELGHAILDALRPQLFAADSIEVAAFHEFYGDASSILCALQLPTLREKVLSETQGQLNATSRLSRVAEQLGWAIRQLRPTAVDGDSLRNAVNEFFYQRPALLPPRAPASQLSSEPHSFSRLFTGAFLDALGGMLVVTGVANDPNLLTVSRDLGQLLVDGVRTAPITPDYFSQVAAAMIQADRTRNNGRYRGALGNAFVRHGILSPTAVAALGDAPVPRLGPAPELPEEVAAMVNLGGFGDASGAQTLLTYGDQAEDDGYRRRFEDAPELPVREVRGEYGLDAPLLAHVPDEEKRFDVAAAALESGSVETTEPQEAALAFVEDLVRLGRIDLGPAADGAAALSAPAEEKTHELVYTSEGWLVQRRFFDCGFRCHH